MSVWVHKCRGVWLRLSSQFSQNRLVVKFVHLIYWVLKYSFAVLLRYHAHKVFFNGNQLLFLCWFAFRWLLTHVIRSF